MCVNEMFLILRRCRLSQAFPLGRVSMTLIWTLRVERLLDSFKRGSFIGVCHDLS